MKLRYFSSKCFHRPIVTYESYLKQLTRLKRAPKGPESVVEFIAANRSLQNRPANVSTGFLDIKLAPSNVVLETQLWNTLVDKKVANYPNIVKAYLNVSPHPTSVSRLFEITTKNFNYQLQHNSKEIDVSVVNNCLNLLLEQKDYYNGFKLIDLTVNSAKYLDFLRNRLKRSFNMFILFNIALTALTSICLLQVFWAYWLAVNVFSSGMVFIGMIKLQTINSVGRLSWRPYNAKLYNYLHKQEILMINKIITHFEEHNEINIRNFHHSNVRFQPNLNILEHEDYILELPGNSQQLTQGPTVEAPKERHIEELQSYFRSQLNERKLVLGDLHEELIFLEFWLTDGDGFEWVEPDQDPAEIVKFKIENKSKVV